MPNNLVNNLIFDLKLFKKIFTTFFAVFKTFKCKMPAHEMYFFMKEIK